MKGSSGLVLALILLGMVEIPLHVDARRNAQRDGAQPSPPPPPPQKQKGSSEKGQKGSGQPSRLALNPTGDGVGKGNRSDANTRKKYPISKQASPPSEIPEREATRIIPPQQQEEAQEDRRGIGRRITGFVNKFSPSSKVSAPERRILAANEYFKGREPTSEEQTLIQLVERATNIIGDVRKLKLDLTTEKSTVAIMEVIGDIDAIMRQLERLPLITSVGEDFQRAVRLLEFVSSLVISLQSVPGVPQETTIRMGLSRVIIEGLGALALAILEVERVAIDEVNRMATVEAEQAALAEVKRQQELREQETLELKERERLESTKKSTLETASPGFQHSLREWADQALKASFALSESLPPLQKYFEQSRAIKRPVKERAINVIEGTRESLLHFLDIISEHSMDE